VIIISFFGQKGIDLLFLCGAFACLACYGFFSVFVSEHHAAPKVAPV
jgi:hypothetical protein